MPKIYHYFEGKIDYDEGRLLDTIELVNNQLESSIQNHNHFQYK